MKKKLLRLHRWLSLLLFAFWLLQAITGALITFHWEAVDSSIPGVHRATDLSAIEARIADLERSELPARSLWTTAGLADRYAIYLQNGQKLVIAGDGTILSDAKGRTASIMATLIGLHHDLLAGEPGVWIVGISGIFLLTNLVNGLVLAWPRRRTWRRSLVLSASSSAHARVYSSHRAIGLWAVVPAIVLVASGVMLRFEDTTAWIVGQSPMPTQAITPSGPSQIGFERAVRSAQRAIPGGKLTAIVFPTDEDATYRIRLLEPGELRRAYGTSSVAVNSQSGDIEAIFRASEAPLSRSFMDGLFPVHTGEAGGTFGRILVTLLGIWLVVMITFGIRLYLARRRVQARKR
jgi:uncharacterized iron-regulated membrane protein